MSRDIIITTNRGTTDGSSLPQISFSGLSGGTIALKVDDDGSLVYDGASGALFNISDSSTGLLHSVNDVSGLPIFQVWDNDLVIAGKWDDYALVVNSNQVFMGGITSTTTNADTILYVSGGTEFEGDVTIKSGNSFIMPSGATDGYVLTTDSGGTATWQVASGGGGGTSVSADTGTVINFASAIIYGLPSAPETTNVTDNLTGSAIGVVQKLNHNHTVEPTFPAGWVLIGDGVYFTSQLNIIYAEWIEGTRVEYWITQEQ